jgi:anaerobic selenocysteine-containing dehydrogenase
MAELKVTPPESWGRSTVQTACPLDCPDSCSLSVTVERGKLIKIDGNTAARSTEGYICGKVRGFDRRVYHAERILHPAVRSGPKGAGLFTRVAWNEALDLIADRMREARDRFGAASVLPYHYGGSNGVMTNDFTDARFFRRFGASGLARTLCAAPTGAAATAMYGRMAGVAYEDYAAARLIVVWGCNPSASGIHLVPHIKRAQKHGARLVVIDPRRTPLARIADLHLAPRPGTDLPVALALIRELFARGWADQDFLAQHATGAEALRAAAEPWAIDRAAGEAQIAARDLATLAEWYGTTSPAVIRCGWGQERNRNGGAATMAILALPAVGGKFGVRGGGYTMSNSGAWGIQTENIIDVPPAATRTVNMNRLGRALLDYQDPPVAVLFVYNCNPIATVPDQNRVRRGLQREDLFTIVHEQVMTDTTAYADVILPATTFLEHYDLAKGYGAYHLHLVQPAIAPVGESRPNHDVFEELAFRLGQIPEVSDLGEAGGFLDLTSRLADDQAAAVVEGRRPPTAGDGTPIQFVDVLPKTPDGRAHLYPTDAVMRDGLYAYAPDPATAEYPLSLISPASANTISSTLGELRPAPARLKIHPDDAGPRAIGDGDPIRIYNALGEVHCTANVTPEPRPGTVSLPKGLWARSTMNGATANALVPDSLTDLAGGACFNDARVQVELLALH